MPSHRHVAQPPSRSQRAPGVTPDFRIASNGLFYDVVDVRSGAVAVELVDCIGAARDYCEEMQGDLDDMRAEEAREAAQAAADEAADTKALDRVYSIIDASRDGTPAMDRACDLALRLIDERLADVGGPLAQAA